jgi:hypothetical protein
MIAKDWKVADWLPTDFPEVERMFNLEVGPLYFDAEIKNVKSNSGQVTLQAFDEKLEERLNALGCAILPHPVITLQKRMTPDITLYRDFDGRSVKMSVEIEKANWEKILRDLLKLHAYLHTGIDLGIIIIPEFHAHNHGKANQLKWARNMIESSLEVGMWNPSFSRKIMLVSFKMYCAETDQEYSKLVRTRFQDQIC